VREDDWEIYQTDEVAGWMKRLRLEDPAASEKVEAAVDVLSEYGPTLGRPLVDSLTGSKIANLKELRPRQTDDDQGAVCLRPVAISDPAGRRGQGGSVEAWYDRAIPRAEDLYAVYLKERAREEEEGR